MFTGLKRWWSFKRLAHQPPARRGARQLRRWSSCQSFLLLLDPMDVRASEQLQHFVAELKKQGKRVDVCTYSDAKELPAHLKVLNYMTIFRPLDVNWYERPVSERALYIANLAADLLIDFTHNSSMPLRWLCHLSHASVKVGFYPNAGVAYDFTIEAGEGSSTRERIELLKQYLGEGLTEA